MNASPRPPAADAFACREPDVAAERAADPMSRRGAPTQAAHEAGQNSPRAPLLILGWGNPARGDDALGPACIDALAAAGLAEGGQVELLCDYQLQIEHVLELVGRARVLFIDAALALSEPAIIAPLRYADNITTPYTHALPPQALLPLFRRIHPDQFPPPCWLLQLRGEHFELGADLSAAATQALHTGIQLATEWVG